MSHKHKNSRTQVGEEKLKFSKSDTEQKAGMGIKCLRYVTENMEEVLRRLGGGGV